MFASLCLFVEKPPGGRLSFLLRKVDVVVDVVGAEAVVTHAAGAVTKLQIWVFRIGPAADGAFVGIESVALLMADAGRLTLKVDGAFALAAGQHVFQLAPAEDQEVQYRHHRQQILREGRSEDGDKEERRVHQGKVLHLDGDDEHEKHLHVRKQRCKRKEHGQENVGGAQAHGTAGDEVNQEAVEDGEDDAGEKVDGKLPGAPLVFQRRTDPIIKIEGDEGQHPCGRRDEHKTNQSPDLPAQDQGRVKEQIIQDFNRIGYSAKAHILNAKDFGIPQNRERVIFIGNRIGIDNESVFEKIFTMGRNKPSAVLNDAISDLPSLEAKRIPNQTEREDALSGYTFSRLRKTKQSDYVKLINSGRHQSILFNHKARYNNERDIDIFGRLNPGDNSADPKIADIMPYKRRERIFKDKYFKLEPDKPCKTITAHMKFDCNMYIHPTQARGLTPREAARVQSYPDDYFFRGAYTKTYMQIGNSVPPLLGRAIASVVKKYMEGYK